MFDILCDELAHTGKVQFAVRAIPGASHTEATEVLEDESIKVRIAAPPEGGKANAELIKFLAKEFRVHRSQIQLIAGAKSRHKLVRISV